MGGYVGPVGGTADTAGLELVDRKVVEVRILYRAPICHHLRH